MCARVGTVLHAFANVWCTVVVVVVVVVVAGGCRIYMYVGFHAGGVGSGPLSRKHNFAALVQSNSCDG